MRHLVLFCALLLCGSATAGIRWVDRYPKARKLAKKADKLLFVFFTNPG
ncbi:hypothetical protein JYT15_01165 [Acidimicrobium ferrooxidans]|nr:hypothetical protein [Acidimicrobium ferrooxidans]